MAVSNQGRLGFIEGMRGVAALYVVLQHCCTMVDPYFRLQRPNAEPQWLATAMAGLWYGHFAVSAFIVLSGFCLQMSLYLRGDGQLHHVVKFLKRRSWRILPPYYACLALSLIVCFTVTRYQSGMPWAQYLPVTPENVAAHVLLIHNFQPEWMYKINGVLWSISVEYQLYFLFPLLAWAMWRVGAAAVLGVTSAMVGASLIMAPSSERLYLWYGVLFVLGMAGARWAYDPRVPRPSALGCWLVTLVAGGTAIASIGWTKELYWRDALMGVAVVSVLMSGVLVPEAWWCRILGWRPLVSLGTFSYSLYLIHHPILQVVYVHRPGWVRGVEREFIYAIGVGVPIMVLGAYAFYWCFERPFLRPPTAHRDSEALEADSELGESVQFEVVDPELVHPSEA